MLLKIHGLCMTYAPDPVLDKDISDIASLLSISGFSHPSYYNHLFKVT